MRLKKKRRAIPLNLLLFRPNFSWFCFAGASLLLLPGLLGGKTGFFAASVRKRID